MACQTTNGPAGGPGQPGSNQFINTMIDAAGSKVPARGNNIITLTTDSGAAAEMGLKRGTYRIETQMEFAGSSPVFIENQEKALPVDGELKRVFFHKIEIKNIRELDAFKNKADAIIEFTVIDNVLPLAPIVWGASIIGSGVAGWFFVDKVQEFTETSTGSIITVAASLLGIFVGIKVLTK